MSLRATGTRALFRRSCISTRGISWFRLKRTSRGALTTWARSHISAARSTPPGPVPELSETAEAVASRWRRAEMVVKLWLTAVALAACAGCTSLSLEHRTLVQLRTTVDYRYEAVLKCLAAVA